MSSKSKEKFKETEIGMIPEGWDVRRIDQLGKVVTGKTPPTVDADNFGGDYPFVTPRDMKGQKHVFETERYLSKNGKDLLKSSLLPEKSVCVSCIGSDMGKVVMTVRESITNQQINSIIPTTVSPDFVYYSLLNTSDKIKNLGKQSTAVPILNKTQFSKISVAVPSSEDEINKISKILSDLDLKIELNQQINKTLESIGQALFKRWFIDFEFPNEKGKPYKSSGGEMVDSELGEIPKAWAVGRLSDICDITMGQSPPGETYNEVGEGLPFYQGIADFGFRFPNRRVYCTGPTRFAKEKDVLLSVRAPVGSLNVADEQCAIGRGLASLCLKERHNGFLYYLLRATKSGWEKFEAEGTVFGSVTKSDVHDFQVIIPPESLIEKFSSLISALDEAISTNEKQSRTLTTIRDSLLPNLMSGRIRVNTEATL